MQVETVADSYPLSPMQQGMLFHSLYAQHSGAGIEQVIFDLHENLNVSAFQQAWQEVAHRHPVLRTSFHLEGEGEPLQYTGRQVKIPLQQHDWRTLPASEQQNRLQAYLESDRQQDFQLNRAPLMRLALFHLSESHASCVWTFHHALLDERSFPILIKEVFAFYDAFCQGQDLQLKQPRPYRDYIQWLQQQDFSKAENFWRDFLRGFSAPTPLVADKAPLTKSNPPGVESANARAFAQQEINLPAAITAQLQSLAKEHQLTLNTLVQGAWALLLSRYTGETDVVFGATKSCRHSTIAGAESMVGLFINTLPVRVSVPAQMDLLPWLKKLRAQWVALRDWEHTPLVKIQGWSELPAGTPLFDSILIFENYQLNSTLRAQGGRWENIEVRLLEQTNYPLTVAAYGGAELSLKIKYDRHRFDDSTITRMLGHIQTLLESMAANPCQSLAELPLLTAQERYQILVEWNSTGANYPKDACLHRLFDAQVERTPDSVAVVFEDAELTVASLTYRQLQQRANQLAHYLQSKGVGPEVLVGICLERSLEMVVGLLGILKAGGAFAPIDPAYPQERLAFMLQDTQVPVLLTQQHLVGSLPQHGAHLIALDADWETIASQSAENPASNVTSDSLAYVIYTSGSTGQPKGVMMEHRSICNQIFWRHDAFKIAETDRILQTIPLAFEPAVWQIFGSLSAGAQLIVAPPGAHQDVAHILRLVNKYQITVLDFVTSMLQVFLQEPGVENCKQLRHVFCGGEPLTPEVCAQYTAKLQASLSNMYGPTEACVEATCWLCPRDSHPNTVPIGRPTANKQIYLLDSHLQPVPVGVPGEIYIGGMLARGYLNRPELTAERFIDNPFLPPAQGDLGLTFPGRDLCANGRQNSGSRQEESAVTPSQTASGDGPHPTATPLGLTFRESDLCTNGRQNSGSRQEESAVARSQTALGDGPHPTATPLGLTFRESDLCANGRQNSGSGAHPTARLYKTGDLARYLPDGNIEFLGRLDSQVKIRGFRIEIGEIESRLQAHPNVLEVAVTAREVAPGDKRLVAYIVPRVQPAPAISDLRSFLQEYLPDYMVPSAFVTLEAMPLTPNGKTDRLALPFPDSIAAQPAPTAAAPRTPVEEALTGIWTEVLGVQKLGVSDNFFELGGHSLLATQIVSRVCRSFQVELPLRCLFESPTIRGLAEAIETARGGSASRLAPPVEPVSRDAKLPLSFAQQRLWFLDQLQPGSSAYTIPQAIRLTGELNAPALERSISEIVRRHEALRTVFEQVDGQPVQVRAPAKATALPVIDLQALPPEHRHLEVERLSHEEAGRPFDLARGPLLRATLLRLGSHEHVLLLTAHHTVFDGWSVGIFFQELAALYEAYRQGLPSPLPELPVQYADFAHWQRQWLAGEVLESQLSYWKQQLSGHLPVLDLPSDRPRPAVRSSRGASQSLLLSPELSEALKALSRREGATLFMTLLAAFQTLLYRQTGQEDIAVGSPIAGRNRAEIEPLIGFFVNTLVFRTHFQGNPTFLELLARARQVALEAYAHQDLPFEKLVEELQPQRDLSRTPLFQVFFNLLNLEENRLVLTGVTAENLPHSQLDSKFDLTLYAREKPEGIHLEFVYSADLFDAERMAGMLDQLHHLLEQIAHNPAETVTRLSLVTPRALALLPNPAQPLSLQWFCPPHTRFCQQAKRVPERLAVADRTESFTYAQLDEKSNSYANYLRAHGAGKQDIVAIYAHRSASLVLALLGILKAGAAFVILDANYPAERLIDCLRQVQPKAWIQMEAAGALPPALEEFVTASGACRLALPQTAAAGSNLLKDFSAQAPEITVAPDDLAYIAFTSGSTGKPKGILGTHRPLSHFLHWHTETFALNESDRFSMLSGLSHDPLLRDIFTPLWLGGTLLIPDPQKITDPGWLAGWMSQMRISVAHLTPAMGQLLSFGAPLAEHRPRTGGTITHSQRPAPCAHLRYAFFGADVLTSRDVALIRSLAPSVTCVNFYGATETPQAMAYYIVPSEGTADSAKQTETEKSPNPLIPAPHSPFPIPYRIPAGRGIQDVQLLVLNGEQQLAGIGELGEIYVRTPYLALGYLGDEALSLQRFVTNPFTLTPADRLYKTGDLGRYSPDGTVAIAGRADSHGGLSGQVKIRGFRIELGEIEGALAQNPAVRQAAVRVWEDATGEKRLVAYAVPHPEFAPAPSELRRFLKEKLPDYMVPSTLVTLEELPLTPNGKVDRRALPFPDTERPELGATAGAPQDTLELQLTQIWEEVLGIKPIGVKDNFFELGGHSLLAVRLFSKIREVFGKELPLPAIFQAPTVEELAGVLRQQGFSAPEESLVLLSCPKSGGGSKPPLFCIYGILLYYDLARHLDAGRPVYGVYLPDEVDLLTADLPEKQLAGLSSVPQLASRYLKQIRTLQPEGPYFLAGESFGGLVAFEMAQQLRAQGETVSLLALFDSLVPGDRKQLPLAERLSRHLQNLSREGLSYALNKAGRRISLSLDKLLGITGRIYGKFDGGSRREAGASLPGAGTLSRPYAHMGNPPLRLLEAAQRDVRQMVRRQAFTNYAPQPYPGKMVLFRAMERNEFDPYYADPQLGWGKLAAGGLEVCDVPGDHIGILKAPNVQIMAAKLRACLERAQMAATFRG